MAASDTQAAIRGYVLLAIGTIGILHETFNGGLAERPFLLGAFCGCLGISLSMGKKSAQ